MASRYWVGGTANWDAATTTNWSATSGGGGGASVPGTSDDVFFNASSGGGTCTVTATQSVLSININGYTGTLDTNGQTVTVSDIFNLGSSGTRALTLGASTLNVGTWTVGSSSGLTFTKGTSTINVTGSSTFTGSNLSYNTLNFTPPADVTIQTLGGWDADDLTVTCNASGTLVFEIGQSIATNVTATFNGVSDSLRLFVRSSAFGSSRTISNAACTVSGQYVDFQDIFIQAGPDLSAITGGSGDCGGNTSITFTTPTTQHWVTSGGGAWESASNWTSRVPLPQDDAIMDASFGTSAQVSCSKQRIAKTVDWSGATYTTALTWHFYDQPDAENKFVAYGSLILVSGLVVESGISLELSGRSSFSLTGNGATIEMGVNIKAPSGTYTLGSDLTLGSSRTLTLTTGTLTCGTYGITAGAVVLGGTATNLGSGTHTLLSTGTVWTGAGTVNGQTSTIKITDTSSSGVTFAGGSKTYNNVWFDRGASTGSITISGSNTFNEFKDSGTAAHSVLWTAGITTTYAIWSVRGSSGNAITINSTTTATYAFVKVGVGVVQTDWLNIQHCVATPGNTWFAGANSVNNQATASAGSGWLFWEKANFRKPTRPALFKPGNAR